MSFHASAQDVRVEDNHILKATLFKADGETVEAELDLNNCFTNSGENFSFGLEGDGVPILRGFLSNVEGETVAADVNLSERIENQNGQLVFKVIVDSRAAWQEDNKR
ncbi:CVNH domain-containing protein [Diplocarpon rosae]|nr:CVNH domain-containing protein [Diplocarpon rosae]